MLSVKELKALLEQCKDTDTVTLEYCGCEFEIENGDTFRNMEQRDVELLESRINIVFS